MASVADNDWWCWIVLIGTFYINFAVDGYGFSFGILKLAIEKDYGPNSTQPVDKNNIAIIGGLYPCLYALLAPIAFGLIAVFSVRTLTICGSLLSCASFALACANQYFQLGYVFDLIFLGITQGVAAAFLFGPSVNAIPTYFDPKRKAMATGITTCGAPAGAMFYGFVLQKLIDALGWRGALLFFSGAALLISLAGLTFVPKTPKNIVEKSFPDEEKNDENLYASSLLPPALELVEEPTGTPLTKRLADEFKNIFSVELFTDKHFITLLLAISCSMLGFFVPIILLPGQSRSPEYNVDEDVQMLMVTLWGLAQLIGRVTFGSLADFGRYTLLCSSLVLYGSGLVLSAIGVIIFPLVMHHGNIAFIVFSMYYGFFSAPFITLQSTIVQDLYWDKHRLIASSFGWVLAAAGIVIVAGFYLPSKFFYLIYFMSVEYYFVIYLGVLNGFQPLYAYLFAAGAFLCSAFFVSLTLPRFLKTYRKKVEHMKKMDQ